MLVHVLSILFFAIYESMNPSSQLDGDKLKINTRLSQHYISVGMLDKLDIHISVCAIYIFLCLGTEWCIRQYIQFIQIE